MTTALDEALADAEHFARIGRYDDCREALAALGHELGAHRRPDVLARAAWVAATVELSRPNEHQFSDLADIAEKAFALVADIGSVHALAIIRRRTGIADEMSRATSPEEALRRVFRAHASLLESIAGDRSDWRWKLVDADRRDWPMLMATLRAVAGAQTGIERAIETARGPVGAVVVAAAVGFEGAKSAGEIAALCFREPATVAIARGAIDELVRRGVLAAESDQRIAVIL